VPTLANEGKILDQPETPQTQRRIRGFIAYSWPKFWSPPLSDKALESGKESCVYLQSFT
jgi:hypothetical protein